MKSNKKLLTLLLTILVLAIIASNAFATVFFDFGGTDGTGIYIPGGSYVYGEAKVVDKLYTRTGPSTRYEEGGSANIVGQEVKVYGWQPDEIGVKWIIVDIRYGGKLRRVYTKSMYLEMDRIEEQVYAACEADKCLDFACVITQNVQPAYGPGAEYELHARTLRAGTIGTYLYAENGHVLVDYDSIRVWVPENALGVLTK